MTSITRGVAALVGCGIIGCVVDAAVMASGGYGAPSARLMIGLGVGVAVGSIAVGAAWHNGHRGIARCLVAALIAGEAWSLLLTPSGPWRIASSSRRRFESNRKLTRERSSV